MLHRLAELDEVVRGGYDAFDFKRVVRALSDFANVELSAFYFDVRKDALYCDAPSSLRRRAALHVIRKLFESLVVWFAPCCPSPWKKRGSRRSRMRSPCISNSSRQSRRLEKRGAGGQWAKIRTVRSVVTGALEIERREKRIGSSLEAAPIVHIADAELLAALKDQDFAEICITSDLTIVEGEGPADAFRLPDVPKVAVVPTLAEGTKCARSWRITKDVGSDPAYPDVSARDAAALRELGFAA